MQTFEELFELIQQKAKIENYPKGNGCVHVEFNSYDLCEIKEMTDRFLALNERGKKGKYFLSVFYNRFGITFTWKSINWEQLKDTLDSLAENLK